MKQLTMKHAIIGILSAFALTDSTAVMADASPFSRIIVFGDSLSDTGNLYQLSGGFPPAPYFNGRFSNGEIWVEYLAKDLGVQLLPEDNYAVGGATTGHDNMNDGLSGMVYPGLQDQVGAFLATLPPSGADADALHVVWIGANDFFAALSAGVDPSQMIAAGVGNTVQTIQQLWQSGARHILVVNIPDLGITPYGLGSGYGESITQLSVAYNTVLDASLESLAGAGVDVIRVDSFSTLQAMAGSPEQYGFSNVTHPFLMTGGDPSSFLFWDTVHPTTRGHEVLADAAMTSLFEHFLPRAHGAAPASSVNSLKGLVMAVEHR